MLTLMCDWTSQINSTWVGALVCLIVDGWYQDLGGMFWRSIHCPQHQDELGVSGIEEKMCVATGYMWVCPYWFMWVHMGSGSRSLAVKHHMFVQSEQGGWILLDLVQADKGLDGQMVENVV